MDEFQPSILPQMASAAHLPQPQGLPCTPLPEWPSSMQPGMANAASMLGRQLLLRRLQTFRPATLPSGDEAYTFPMLKLAAKVGQQPETARQSSQAGIPRTPPCSIPGYFPSNTSMQEPQVGEALLGCGILLLLSIIALTILYYLSI